MGPAVGDEAGLVGGAGGEPAVGDGAEAGGVTVEGAGAEAGVVVVVGEGVGDGGVATGGETVGGLVGEAAGDDAGDWAKADPATKANIITSTTVEYAIVAFCYPFSLKNKESKEFERERTEPLKERWQ